MPDRVRNIDEKVLLNGSSISYRSLPSYHMAAHQHEALQILIPLEGTSYEISWELEDKSIEIKPLSTAEICIIPPLLQHEIRWSGPANFINIYVTPSYIDNHVENGFDVQTNVVEAHIGFQDSMLYQLAQSIRQYFWKSKQHNVKYFDALLTVISQHIVTHYLQSNEHEELLYKDYQQVPCEKIRSSILFMQNNLERNVNVEELAETVGMSQYHFIRTFKETMGIPPSKFHTMQRIEKAKELLKKGNRIIDVAMQLGFSSQSHFSNVFTKAIGVTPKKFANH